MFRIGSGGGSVFEGASYGDKAAMARVRLCASLEAQLEPLGLPALSALDVKPGERVLDIGCGTGGTTGALGTRVRADGHVLGIDKSPVTTRFAQARFAHARNIDFLCADAEAHSFQSQCFDAAFSRFGVMFFADPAAGFANLKAALRPKGRLAFICWRSFAENDVDWVPLRAASAYLPADVDDPASAAPFSLADRDVVHGLLGKAGFRSIEVTAQDQLVGQLDLATVTELSLSFGALGKILRERPDLRDTVTKPVGEALAALDRGKGPELMARTWLVTAQT